MFIRRKHNKSGTFSVQIISKHSGRYKVIKTFGSSDQENEILNLEFQAKQYILDISNQSKIFHSDKDKLVEDIFSELLNSNIRTIGPELVFGKIYDSIGYSAVKEEMFRHLVISRLAFPLSKLKTIDYLYRYTGVSLDIDQVYRFLDKLNNKLKTQIEQISFNHTLKLLKGNIHIVFYDMTTLYFESSDEDDLRRTGFSKDGKHSNPQIFLGLLVTLGGYAIGYDIFEGNIYEGNTIIPFIEKISAKFNLLKPIIVADSGLLSKKNIQAFEQMGYKYIIGGRIKNENSLIKQMILKSIPTDGQSNSISKSDGTKLVFSYSISRAIKDGYNRKRGLQRLEKQIKSGKLNKTNINNKGYNKYLKMSGDVKIEIDYDKYSNDGAWDGIKGYITNSDLSNEEIIHNYNNLWQIEKAFRMSKTDLRIRPIYHRLRNRIEAHICISFVSYSIYKELERVLYNSKSKISLKRAAELTHNMYQITYTLPDAKYTKTKLLKMDKEQTELYEIISKAF